MLSKSRQYYIFVFIYAVSLTYWTLQLGYSQYFDSAPVITLHRESFRYLFITGCLTGAAVVLFGSRIITRRIRPFFTTLALWCCVCLFALTLLPMSNISNYWIYGIFYFAAGSGSAWGYILALLFLKRISNLSNLIWLLTAIQIASQTFLAITQAFVLCSWQIGTLIASALVFASCLLLCAAFAHKMIDNSGNTSIPSSTSDAARREHCGGSSESATLISELKRNWAQYAVIAGSAITVIASRVVGPYGIWGLRLSMEKIDVDFFALAMSFVLFALLQYLVISGIKKSGPSRGAAIPFVIFSLIFAALLLIDYLHLGEYLYTVLIECLYIHASAMAMFYAVRYSKTIHSVLIAGSVAQAAMAGLSALWLVFMEESDLLSTATALVLSYAFMTVAILLIPRIEAQISKEQKDTPSNPKSNPSTMSPISMREAIAKEANLTPRETEVLGFLLQGRTLPYISKELFISEGTVRSHVRAIYKKTNVHSKQELIDLALGEKSITQATSR